MITTDEYKKLSLLVKQNTMVIIRKHGYHIKYAFGGSELFDTIAQVMTSGAANNLAADKSKNILETAAKHFEGRASSKIMDGT